MKKNREIKSLEELEEKGVIKLGRGVVISRKDLMKSPGDYPVYSSAKLNNGIFGQYGKYMFDEELITWSVDGGGSLFYRAKHKFSITNVGGYCRILKGDVMNYKYLYFILTYLHSTIKFDWVKKAHPSVLRREYKKIPLPLLSEQKRIVSILDKLFSDIEKAKANTEQNLKKSKKLFENYLQSVFENENWKEKALNEICEVKDGTHDSPKYIKEGIPFVTQKNIRQEGLSFFNTKFITKNDHEKFYKRSDVTYGDILISMIGANRGMVALVDDKRIFSIKNVGLIKESKNINKDFLLYYLKSFSAMKYVLRMSNGGAQEFIGLTALRSFPIPFPPLKEQQVIVQKLNKLNFETKKLEDIYRKKIAYFEELKKSILQKAFNGEL